jgi:hypothetical protein
MDTKLMESILQQESDKVDTDGVPGITTNDKTMWTPLPFTFGGSFMSYKGLISI